MQIPQISHLRVPFDGKHGGPWNTPRALRASKMVFQLVIVFNELNSYIIPLSSGRVEHTNPLSLEILTLAEGGGSRNLDSVIRARVLQIGRLKSRETIDVITFTHHGSWVGENKPLS